MPPREFSIWVRINSDLSLPDQTVPCSFSGASMALEAHQGCQEYDGPCVTAFIGALDNIKKVSGYTL
jgi:hypothetical protein